MAKMQLSDERKIRLLSELKFTATRSSGPGGQNVNKVSSRVELRFSIEKSEELNQEEKERLYNKLKNRINAENELILTAQTERSQLVNKEKVTDLFYILLEKSLTIPKHRKRTSPTVSSKVKRLENKKITGFKKQLRRPPEI